MKLMPRFVLSHNQYAVDLNSFRIDSDCGVRVNAYWFRRRRGVDVACLGFLWGYQGVHSMPPWTALEFLERLTDNRYGGTCEGRWDGQGYWGSEDPVTVATHLETLRPMLRQWGHVPPHTTGWWEL
jgi:hypothetical protein